MSKKVLSLLLACVLLLTVLAIPADAKALTGDERPTDAQVLRWAVKKGIVDAETYDPDGTMTLGEYVNAVWMMMGSPEPAKNDIWYTDVPEDYEYRQAIMWGRWSGLLNTPNHRRIAPDTELTRIMVLYNLYRYVKCPQVEAVVHYTDTANTAYYIKGLDWAYENDMVDIAEGLKFRPHAVAKNSETLYFLCMFDRLINPVKKLSDYKWVAFGNSLTDDTGACGKGAPNKYHKVIAEATGMDVSVAALGGTGYWKGIESGTNYYSRMAKLAVDPDVDVVTIFGSVNDWKYWRGVSRTTESYYDIPTMGLDKDGNPYTFAQFHRVRGNYALITKEEAAATLSFTDTVANTENTAYGVSWVAYVNECINIAHEKFPNAKIVLVDEIYFSDTRFYNITADLRTVKEALVDYRASNGDTWLSFVKLEDSTYAGLDVPENLYGDTIEGEGLSFDQLSDKTFADYYTYDGKGHPNDLYHRIWLAPVYANILCGALNVDPDTLPPELQME